MIKKSANNDDIVMRAKVLQKLVTWLLSTKIMALFCKAHDVNHNARYSVMNFGS